jgi:hypothetical protein
MGCGERNGMLTHHIPYRVFRELESYQQVTIQLGICRARMKRLEKG